MFVMMLGSSQLLQVSSAAVFLSIACTPSSSGRSNRAVHADQEWSDQTPSDHAEYNDALTPLLMQDLRTAYRDQREKERPQFPDLVRMQLTGPQPRAGGFLHPHAGRIEDDDAKHVEHDDYGDAPAHCLQELRDHGNNRDQRGVVSGPGGSGSDPGCCVRTYGVGRNLPLDGIESIMGPCPNIVPLRMVS